MSIAERITALRALMADRGYDVYMVPTDDNHQSEYVGEHFKARAFITGFTGSAGTAVITKDEAGLWTDGRYFIQACLLYTSTVNIRFLNPAELVVLHLQGKPCAKEENPV